MNDPGEYLVRVDRELVDRLIADDSEPAVIVRVEARDDGTHEMHLKTTDVIAENQRLRDILHGLCGWIDEAVQAIDLNTAAEARDRARGDLAVLDAKAPSWDDAA